MVIAADAYYDKAANDVTKVPGTSEPCRATYIDPIEQLRRQYCFLVNHGYPHEMHECHGVQAALCPKG